MNVHDSEKIAGILVDLDYVKTSDIFQADVIVLNTCCIRNTAENKILGRIGELKKLKEKNRDLIIALLGCMIQQDGKADNLLEKYPYIDILIGTKNIFDLYDAIKSKKTANKSIKSKTKNFTSPFKINDFSINSGGIPIYRSSFPNAWVSIIQGCDNFCSYCIVPYVRGREISSDPAEIIETVHSLLDTGYKEITLLGQNVNSYGKDRNDNWNFNKLITRLAEINKKYRLRFMTSNPKDFTEELVNTISKYDNISKHVHIPLQSGSDNILKLMNRKYSMTEYYKLIELIKKIPNIGITTDIMVGFPGETENDFNETMKAIENIRFHNAFMFVYSPRKGTLAASLPQIPYHIKKERISKIVERQNSISLNISNTFLGNNYEILVEDFYDNTNIVCGRTDNGRLVKVPGDKDLIGQFINVRVNKCKGSSLIGEIINE